MVMRRLHYESDSRARKCLRLGIRPAPTAPPHGMTSIAGELRLSPDVRAYEEDVLAALQNEILASIKMIEERRRVRFKLGERKTAAVGYVSKPMMASLIESANFVDVVYALMNSQASHDAGAFSAVAIPAGMVFVWNQNGSHNPQEEMHIDDFLAASVVFQWLVQDAAGI